MPNRPTSRRRILRALRRGVATTQRAAELALELSGRCLLLTPNPVVAPDGGFPWITLSGVVADDLGGPSALSLRWPMRVPTTRSELARTLRHSLPIPPRWLGISRRIPRFPLVLEATDTEPDVICLGATYLQQEQGATMTAYLPPVPLDETGTELYGQFRSEGMRSADALSAALGCGGATRTDGRVSLPTLFVATPHHPPTPVAPDRYLATWPTG